MELLWGGGWRAILAEARGGGGGAELGGGFPIEGSGLPHTRALNAHFAGALRLCAVPVPTVRCAPCACVLCPDVPVLGVLPSCL